VLLTFTFPIMPTPESTQHQRNSLSNRTRLTRREQVSAVADELPRRAASRQTCCKQRWTLSVINLWQNFSWERLRRSTFSSYRYIELFVESR